MTIKHIPLKKCPQCGGTTDIECRDCKGTGFDFRDASQCENCDGTGKVDCDNPVCDGGFVAVDYEG